MRNSRTVWQAAEETGRDSLNRDFNQNGREVFLLYFDVYT